MHNVVITFLRMPEDIQSDSDEYWNTSAKQVIWMLSGILYFIIERRIEVVTSRYYGNKIFG